MSHRIDQTIQITDAPLVTKHAWETVSIHAVSYDAKITMGASITFPVAEIPTLIQRLQEAIHPLPSADVPRRHATAEPFGKAEGDCDCHEDERKGER